MKKIFILAAIISNSVLAQEVYVVSVVPRMITIQQEQCQQIPVARQSSGSSAGGVVGAIVGAALGNQIGDGRGRDIATAAGAVIGGQVGRGEPQSTEIQYRTVCNTFPMIVNRGEIVTFSYKGRRFTQIFE